MSELAVPEKSNEIERPTAPIEPHPSALVQWAMEAREAAQIAESLSKTSFVPSTLRGKPADITAAILAGQELGLRPMATLRSLDVIQGTPALRAHAMRGLVQSHGHSIQLVESTPEKCVMRGRRRGESDWQTVEWDLKRAAALGLLSKSEWKKQPKTMLVARATGEISRLIASDVLYAMPYAAEELWGQTPDVHVEFDERPVTADEVLTAGAPAVERAPVEQTSWTTVDQSTEWTDNEQNDEPAQWPATAQPGQGANG